MSQVETFRIVDVLAGDDNAGPARSSSSSPSQAPSSNEQPNSNELALWSSPSHSVEAVSSGRPAPTMGLEHIRLPRALDQRLVMLREPQSARARSFRLLRHRLLSGTDPRIVAVTSPRPGDGKTTCALNLALAIAEEEMVRVLLLEANLKSPCLGQVLGFEPSGSLLEDITRYTDAGPRYPVAAIYGTRLHVAALRGGDILPEARLDRTLFTIALRELRTIYDYIVVDAASVLASADADVVGECSNGVILAMRAGASRKSDLRRAVDQLAPAPILGTVLFDA